MRRAIFVAIVLFLFPLAFLPGDVSCSSPCTSSIAPPFVASGVKPNILIILDNSNSMDEDFYGNAVGSYSSSSKTVVAKAALQTLVTDLQNQANVGVMSFALPSDVAKYYVHNSMPFASYDPYSYCADPPDDCVTYCSTGDSTAQANCEAGCPGLTTHKFANGTYFPDSIITYYATGNSTRARYCDLTYPKTNRMANPTDTSNYIYWKQADPFYDSGNQGTKFGYCGSDDTYHDTYSAAESASNTYRYYTTKTGTTDAFSGYSNYSASYSFQPTDSDWALGFYNFGQRMPWYYVGPTWFSSSVASSSNLYLSTYQGYLNVAISALSTTTQYNSVYNILAPYSGDSTSYMACTSSNKNTCSYIVNAGNTPTAGTLLTALTYFKGGLTGITSPISSVCQKNYIIFVTDGLPSTNLAGKSSTDTSSLMTEVITELTALQTNVSKTFSGTSTTFPVKTYVLGLGLSSDAKTNLDKMAVAGGTQTATGHAYYADDPSAMTSALETIMVDLLGRVSAGSSVSILSEGQTVNGSNVLQGVFYPSKYFGAKTVTWPGYLYDYWYYSTTTYNNIREDTVHDYILELDEDYGITFTFDTQTGLSVNRYSDSSGSGNPATYVDNVGLDSLTPIWEAGRKLFDKTSASRTIYTPGTSTTNLVTFDTTNTAITSTTASLLGLPSSFDSCLVGTSDAISMQNLINYIRGTDSLPNSHCYSSTASAYNSTTCTKDSDCTSGTYTSCKQESCRNRTVSICSNGASCTKDSDCTSGSCTTGVWKMGDIVYSSPKVEADYSYCSNGTSFNSVSCTADTDCTTGTYTSCVKKESIVYVGANDGMLHAFKTGIISTTGMDSSKYQIATLTGISTSDMGNELWAFIPRNSLPYLRCLAVPPPNSCHLYYNDLSPYITTMVSNSVSKKVLIGGMRLGGGSIASGKYCFNSSGVSNGTTCSTVSDCTSPYNKSCSTNYYINAPPDTCSQLYSPSTLRTTATICSDPTTCYNPSTCVGLSSYYAIDITDAENPKLLWEFSHPFLGYTYSGPAVIHKWTNPSTQEGDQYYVMFLSGPTDPMYGTSIQDVQAFVLTLDANLAISSVYYKDLGLQDGFGGRLFTSGLDMNSDGYTDFVFFGYANCPTGSSTAWTGGIGKVNTNNTDATLALSPKNWTYDTTTYSTIAKLPITSRVATEQCFGNYYLYAGTGRYFFAQDNYGGPSTSAGLNYLMGIPFTCDQYNSGCTAITSLTSSSTSACSSVQQGTFTSAGWEYTLNDADTADGYLRERLTTDPTVTSSNIIYFTTSRPTSDTCGYGGESRVWGLNCATGGAISDTSCSGYSVTDLTGTLYLQTSTGAIYKIDASTSFTDTSTGGRTTSWMVGIPPENSPPSVSTSTTPFQSGQMIQWIER